MKILSYLRGKVLQAQIASGTLPDLQVTLIPDPPVECIGFCAYSGIPIQSDDSYTTDSKGRLYLINQISTSKYQTT